MNSPVSLTLLRGGRLVDPLNNLDHEGDLLIEGERIAAVGEIESIPYGTQIVELDGDWILPSLADLHVALRDPGYEYKETLEALVESAVAGGYTHLIVSPDTFPVVDTGPMAAQIVARAERLGKVAISPLGALLAGLHGDQLADLNDLAAAGVVGFSDGGRPIARSSIMRRGLEYLALFGTPLFLRCEDPDLAQAGVMHEGVTSTLLGLKGVPSEAEEVSVYQALALAHLTRGRVHLTQLSSARSVELVRGAKQKGVRVTCDVSPHHLWFSAERVRGYGSAARVSPPLRDSSDRQALIQGINDGTIDAIASGHTPQSLLEKEVEFEAAQPGGAGLETGLAAVLTLVERGEVERARALDALCHQPRRIVGFSPDGLVVGARADLTVLAPGVQWQVNSSLFRSPASSTPFEGVTLSGVVRATYFAGRPVFGQEMRPS